ncbi:MAG: cysteine--tRNA ligase [Bacteroidales bacterium]|nr:cysteine--tRNA ligase [Bacteroidales bacterium]
MQSPLYLYNTLTRRKEPFEPLHPPFVGMYVCGPTVYSETHLGHARPAITFDILFRWLQHLGYRVRYVRNITDVGHLENDADSGEDKIGKKARLEQLEPMEIVQRYMNSFHYNMQLLNTLPPSIEPMASGHIIEQQQMVQEILRNGYAYEVNGSVYFDVERYNKDYHYGKLSGRVLDDLLSYTRDLSGTEEKRSPYDFALWKKADPAHIMRWPSPWGEGYPGWHLECSVMSTKYLGEVFDIHGGGMDLLFPHHECEIAQNVAARGKESVRYWIHNNMITINGQKMARSLNNFITLQELFSGRHPLLAKAYSPMTVRFFILQAHYRSTLDFSNEALQAAEKGLERLLLAMENLERISPSPSGTVDTSQLEAACREAMNDDLNTPVLIALLFEQVKVINQLLEGTASIDATHLENLKRVFRTYGQEILGLQAEKAGRTDDRLPALVDLVLRLRQEARQRKDFASSDRIRDALLKLGIEIKDTKQGTEWRLV